MIDTADTEGEYVEENGEQDAEDGGAKCADFSMGKFVETVGTITEIESGSSDDALHAVKRAADKVKAAHSARASASLPDPHPSAHSATGSSGFPSPPVPTAAAGGDVALSVMMTTTTTIGAMVATPGAPPFGIWHDTYSAAC